jgi:hypothetical protein
LSEEQHIILKEEKIKSKVKSTVTPDYDTVSKKAALARKQSNHTLRNLKGLLK